MRSADRPRLPQRDIFAFSSPVIKPLPMTQAPPEESPRREACTPFSLYPSRRLLYTISNLLGKRGSADRRFCGPRLFPGHHRHRAVFYRGVETPASFPFRSAFLHLRAPARAARETHRKRTRTTKPVVRATRWRRPSTGRGLHPFYLTAWVFLPDHWHCICAPVHPTAISLGMKKKPRTTKPVVRATHSTSPWCFSCAYYKSDPICEDYWA